MVQSPCVDISFERNRSFFFFSLNYGEIASAQMPLNHILISVFPVAYTMRSIVKHLPLTYNH